MQCLLIKICRRCRHSFIICLDYLFILNLFFSHFHLNFIYSSFCDIPYYIAKKEDIKVMCLFLKNHSILSKYLIFKCQYKSIQGSFEGKIRFSFLIQQFPCLILNMRYSPIGALWRHVTLRTKRHVRLRVLFFSLCRCWLSLIG